MKYIKACNRGIYKRLERIDVLLVLFLQNKIEIYYVFRESKVLVYFLKNITFERTIHYAQEASKTQTNTFLESCHLFFSGHPDKIFLSGDQFSR